jgi:uncharacterized protein (TIRG00374 family)
MSNGTLGVSSRSKFVLVVQAAVTFICLYLVARQVDWVAFKHNLFNVDLGILTVGVLVLCLQPIIGTLRWRVITRALGARLGLVESTTLTYLGMFFNQALPASVGGDAIRIWLMHRHKHSLRMAFNSVALDRIFMLSGLFLLVAAGLSFVDFDLQGLRFLIVVAIAVVSVAFALVCVADRFSSGLGRPNLLRLISAVSADTRTVLLSLSTMTSLLVLVVLSYASMSISLFLIILSFGESMEFRTGMALLPTVLLASVLPISIGGWGAREAATVGILGLIGVSAPAALGASVIFGVSSVVVTLPGLVLYLLHRRELKGVEHLDFEAAAATAEQAGP